MKPSRPHRPFSSSNVANNTTRSPAIEDPCVMTCCKTHSSLSSDKSAARPSGTMIPSAKPMTVKQFGIQTLCEQVCRIVRPTPVFEFQQPITHLFSQPVQTNLDMTRPSWNIHGLHKLQCGAGITLKPYNDFLWLINLMQCKQKSLVYGQFFPNATPLLTH